jgi:uncharacterized protein YukE
VPNDTEEIQEELHNTLAELNQKQTLLRKFFEGAELSME